MNFELTTLCNNDGFYEIFNKENEDLLEDIGLNRDFAYLPFSNLKSEDVKLGEFYDLTFVDSLNNGDHLIFKNKDKEFIDKILSNLSAEEINYLNIFKVKNRISFKEWLGDEQY